MANSATIHPSLALDRRRPGFLIRDKALRVLVATLLFIGLGIHGARAQDEPNGSEVSRLLSLSLDQLGAVEITSVSRHAENRDDAASAVFVLTADDMRRSGATTVPEALRLVPGVQVARIDANKWAISARGFNDRFANKLLVLVDGRSVYSPLFSGVFWDAQSLPLAEIAQIEVIRGPGATMWGSNAVNGVINIITRDSRETLGGSVKAVGGLEDRGMAALRHGGRFGATGFYRADVSGLSRRGEGSDSPLTPDDSWKLLRGALRLDLTPSPRDDVSLHVSGHAGDETDEWRVLSVDPLSSGTEFVPHRFSGVGFSAHWLRRFSARHDLALSANLESNDRDIESIVRDRNRTFNIEGMTRFPLGATTTATLGGGGRYIDGEVTARRHIRFVPAAEDLYHYSAFAHLEQGAAAGRLRMSLGAKVERNAYTGIEVQPNARALWKSSESGSLWGAVSRALRTPSRAETGVELLREIVPQSGSPLPDDLVVRIIANPEAVSEELTAYELGYRNRLGNAFRFDLAAYHNVYRRLRNVASGPIVLVTDVPDPYLMATYEFASSAHGQSTGAEIELEWAPTQGVRVLISASHGDIQMTDPGLPDGGPKAYDPGMNPKTQAVARLQLNPLNLLDLDLALRHVGALSTIHVPAYTTLDTRVGLRLGSRLEVGLVGQNLVGAEHSEFVDLWLSAKTRPVGRNVFFTSTFTFPAGR